MHGRLPTLVAVAAADRLEAVGVREDCRHYSSRTSTAGEVVQRCKLGANEEVPFACPEDCVFFEPRAVSDTGWQINETDE